MPKCNINYHLNLFKISKDNVSSMTLRSGKELKKPRKNREAELQIEVNKLEPN